MPEPLRDDGPQTVVDYATGEVIRLDNPRYHDVVRIVALEDHIAGLQSNIAGWAHRYAELKRDKQAEAEQDPNWPVAVRVFLHWQQVCKHPNSEWTVERFEDVLPYLKGRKYGPEMCLRAIAGAAYDPFVSTRKNGSTHRHDSWELIFQSPGKFESFANRAPKGWQPPPNVLKPPPQEAL